MSHTRTQIAHAVADTFLPAKKDVISAASASARVLATLIEEAAHARLQPGEGEDVLLHALDAVSHAFNARASLVKAHAGLAQFRAAWNIQPNAFGVDDTPSSLVPRGLVELKSVA